MNWLQRLLPRRLRKIDPPQVAVRSAQENLVHDLSKEILGLLDKPEGKRYQLQEVVAALGLSMIRLGQIVLEKQFPEIDYTDFQAVEKHYMVQPTMAAAMILQGHIMLGAWQEEEEDNASSFDHFDLGDSGGGASSSLL